MNIQLLNGNLFINNNEVSTVVYKNGEVQVFPIKDYNAIDITHGNNNSIDVKGDGNFVVQQKNVISGATIITAGSFHLGDK